MWVPFSSTRITHPTISFRQRKTAPSKKSDLLKCLTPDTDTPSSLESQDLDDDTDLATCLQHVAVAESSVGELDVVELDAGLLSSIEQAPVSEQLDNPPSPSSFDTKILDGTAVLHFLPTAGISTFEDCANNVFLPYIRHQLEGADRADVVCDTYNSSSIKESA